MGKRRVALGYRNLCICDDGRGLDVPEWPQLRSIWNWRRQKEEGSGAILAVNVVWLNSVK